MLYVVSAGAKVAEAMGQVVRQIVDEPDAVEVGWSESTPGHVTISLKVSAADLGKIIGKQGRTARSLRTLLQAMKRSAGLQFNLDIVQTDAGPSGETEEPCAISAA